MEAGTEVCHTEPEVEASPGEPRSRAGFLKCSQEIRLDPNSAHSLIKVSQGNRKGTSILEYQPRPDHPDRFTGWRQVLGLESLTGRSYWEVRWTGRGVRVGVAYRSISRTGIGNECGFGFNDRSWMLDCSGTGYTFWHREVLTPVWAPRSSTVGVYVDHRAGVLSFYSVSETITLLHREHTTFTEPLHAALCIYNYGDVAEFIKLPDSTVG